VELEGRTCKVGYNTEKLMWFDDVHTSTLKLILPLAACNKALTSAVLFSSIGSTYFWSVAVELGIADRRLVRFQDSKPLINGATAVLKLTSRVIIQPISASWSSSSCQGV
jgi:hypothetical protein